MSGRAALRAECTRLSEMLLGLTEADFGRATGCPPWTVRDLVAHVRTAVGRLPVMLAQPAPLRAEVDAAGYYGPAKFTPDTDAARVDGARREAGEAASGHALAEDLSRTWRAVDAAIAAEAPGRVVRTRHGDPMTLDDFVLTRVVEVGVHGLDLAAALDRAPWLTEPAAEAITALLLDTGDTGADAGGGGGPGGPANGRVAAVLAGLGWDRLTMITKATGRVPLTGAERAEVDRRGVRWLSFG